MITKKEALAQIKEYVKAQEDEVVQFLKDSPPSKALLIMKVTPFSSWPAR